MSDVALIQLISGAVLEDNLTATARLMKCAQQQGAQLVVLPENFALLHTEGMRPLAEKHLDDVVQFLCQQASELGVWIVAGSLPMVHTETGAEVDMPKVRSVCLVIDALGNIRARYDKIHLFDVDVADAAGQYRESDAVDPGDQLVVVDTPVGALGLTICYDLRFPEQFQRLRDAGAELVTVPSAFTSVTGEAHWDVLLRARAIENQLYVLGCNQGGKHSETRYTWGRSMVVDPWGRVVAKTEMGEALVVADIDLESVRDVREKMPVMFHRHRAGF